MKKNMDKLAFKCNLHLQYTPAIYITKNSPYDYHRGWILRMLLYFALASAFVRAYQSPVVYSACTL